MSTLNTSAFTRMPSVQSIESAELVDGVIAASRFVVTAIPRETGHLRFTRQYMIHGMAAKLPSAYQ